MAKSPKAPAKGQKMQALYALHWMPTLTPSARVVGAWLVWHANATSGRCDPGRARLRAETGLSERMIRYAVNELVAEELIRRTLRGQETTSYTVLWQNLSAVAADYERRAKERENPVVSPEERAEGRGKGLPLPPAMDCLPIRQPIAPKPTEKNSLNEPVFPVGTIPDKSGNGAFPVGVDFSHEEIGTEGTGREAAGAWEKRGTNASDHPDDVVGRHMLSIWDDNAFLAALDREVKAGRLFAREITDHIYERLDHLCGQGEYSQGDPVAGRAYRLLETDFTREAGS